jgi:hypothetical protein
VAALCDKLDQLLRAERVVAPSPSRPQPQHREQRIGDRRPWGISVGEAVREADANAGRG